MRVARGVAPRRPRPLKEQQSVSAHTLATAIVFHIEQLTQEGSLGSE
jgi:hypothetical protein